MTEAINNSLVTGGTKGIGRVIAEVLRDRGDRVITLSRSQIMNDENHISMDMSNIEDISSLPSRIASVDIHNLVFCHRYRGDSWEMEFKVSLEAVCHLIENVKKLASLSSIVIIGSSASSFVFEEQSTAYHASRAALENITRNFAVQLGPQGTRCNCILPGGDINQTRKQGIFF